MPPEVYCGNEFCDYTPEQLGFFQIYLKSKSVTERDGAKETLESTGADFEAMEACYEHCEFMRAHIASLMDPKSQQAIAAMLKTIKTVKQARPRRGFYDDLG